MSPLLGFVLVTHTLPEQTAFLCWKLSAMFGDPPIAIHHDYSKCPLDPATLPSQVRIVADWKPTAWGAITQVEAYLAALRLLHEHEAPQWTISLSAADYPVKSADAILQDLSASTADALLDFREIASNGKEPEDARSHADTFKTSRWMKEACGRYLGFSMVHYHLRRLVGRKNRPFYLRNALTTRLFTPFRRDFKPYGGDWWHVVNRRAALALLEDSKRARQLRHFYRNRISPDESYVQTILLNRPDLRAENDNRRYAIWIGDASHPKVIGREDVPTLVASSAHFARKFPFDLELYRFVDEQIAMTHPGSSDVQKTRHPDQQPDPLNPASGRGTHPVGA